jgi:hypothetical protein
MTALLEELRGKAIASLDEAIATFRDVQLSENEIDSWTPDLVALFADGMTACRWLLGQGFSPPNDFGMWLFGTLQERVPVTATHRELSDRIYKAGGDLHAFEEQRALEGVG